MYFHLCSKPVEGRGHRLHKELDESLTEDDAGADQQQATCNGGNRDCQDQWRWDLVLRCQPLRGYRENTNVLVSFQDLILKRTASIHGNYVPALLTHVTLSLARTSSSSQRQRMSWESSSRLHLCDWQSLQFNCNLISHSPWLSMAKGIKAHKHAAFLYMVYLFPLISFFY